MTTYKSKITKAMKFLADQPDTVFIGQGLTVGDRIYGTMNDVPIKKCSEFPVAENLIAGAAIGMSLRKLRPIVVFQRMDFMTIAADAIINHMNLIHRMSGGEIYTPVIIRAIVGSQKTSFDVGLQHNKDLSVMFPEGIILQLDKPEVDIERIYKMMYADKLPSGVIIVEYKDLYNETN